MRVKIKYKWDDNQIFFYWRVELKRKKNFNIRKQNQKNEDQIEQKVHHKLWLNDEIKN
jgi:hypothetical protein